jgi:hypothetical protein
VDEGKIFVRTVGLGPAQQSLKPLIDRLRIKGPEAGGPLSGFKRSRLTRRLRPRARGNRGRYGLPDGRHVSL